MISPAVAGLRQGGLIDCHQIFIVGCAFLSGASS